MSATWLVNVVLRNFFFFI